MIHATAKAIALLKTGSHDGPPDHKRACTGDGALDGDYISCTEIHHGIIPTCPRCAVLWDEALSAQVTP